MKKPGLDYKPRLSQASFGNRGFAMSDVRDDGWLNNIFGQSGINQGFYDHTRDKMSFDFTGAHDKKE